MSHAQVHQDLQSKAPLLPTTVPQQGIKPAPPPPPPNSLPTPAERTVQPVPLSAPARDPLANDQSSYRKVQDVTCYDLTTNYGLQVYENVATGQNVAIKWVPRIEVNESVVREVTNHCKLLHPNIIQFVQLLLTDEWLGIVMEPPQGSKLLTLINSRNRLPEQQACLLTWQLVDALLYCHSQGVVNRDLRLENIVVDDNMVLKLCDFSYSKYYVKAPPRTRVGSPVYMAPEVLAGPAAGQSFAYPDRIDSWSVGVLLFCMVYGNRPFDVGQITAQSLGDMLRDMQEGIWRRPRGVSISGDLQSLLEGVLEADPNKRLSLKEVQEHSWFKAMQAQGVSLPSLDGKQAPEAMANQALEQVRDILLRANPEVAPYLGC